MHNACSVLSGHIVSRYHTERALSRVNPRKKLLIIYTHKVGALNCCHHLIRHKLVALVIFVESELAGLCIKKRAHKRISGNHSDRLA